MESQNQQAFAAEERLVLNEQTIGLLWSKTYNTNGKPDWSHIYQYYHDDIVFQDTIQRIEVGRVHRALQTPDRPLQGTSDGSRHDLRQRERDHV